MRERRIILSPFIYLMYLFIGVAGLIFPTSMIMLLSVGTLIQAIFREVLEWAGHEFDEELMHFDITDKHPIINSLLGITILLWGPVLGAYTYIKTGDIHLIND